MSFYSRMYSSKRRTSHHRPRFGRSWMHYGRREVGQSAPITTPMARGAASEDWGLGWTAEDRQFLRSLASAEFVCHEGGHDSLALATDFPRLWHDPATSIREKRRMTSS